jgi:putative ABC transport system permease protein
MVLCLFLAAVLPVTVNRLLDSFEQGIYARAKATPSVIGALGSPLDLALQSLYFNRKLDQTLPYGEYRSLDGRVATDDNDRIEAVPIHVAHTARSYPIVATNNDYFRFRSLQLSQGRLLGIIGECVVGADVAEALQLNLGDGLLSDRPDLLGLAGDYPLKLKVVGILSRESSADDRAVFVDLKTQWIIEGLGHGHQDLASDSQSANVKREAGRIVALPSKVVPYTEITSQNIASFHFHGSLNDFPISAIIVRTPNLKYQTLLEAKYQNNDRGLQFIRPEESLQRLVATLFKVRRFINLNTWLIGISTGLLTGLVMLLSLKLRQKERETMFKIGCDRKMIAMIHFAEMAVIISLALAMAVVFAILIDWFAERGLENWIAGQ